MVLGARYTFFSAAISIIKSLSVFFFLTLSGATEGGGPFPCILIGRSPKLWFNTPNGAMFARFWALILLSGDMDGVNCNWEVELLPRPSKYGEKESDADFGEPDGDESVENCLRGSGRSFGNMPTPWDSETGIT